ncbi:TetR/AcrR family transcriptional regulator [Jiangella asiatica]|uniref:TetR/AcrR family transcriptional regulator n=1 Tax=Jiangella asiatica TaxID=2530372 RepID=A0A4R5DH19_9ACTN|nr:TetR/AcrR family transcriptional regulator [Jiangella asiatica]TDE11211.1 TetR/AcrR family transcriptional regulator [Jiangella asiatica]
MPDAPLRMGRSRESELLDAVVEVLRETGYDRLTVDAVVAKARASKTTVYRRWPTKSELVIAAVSHATNDLPVNADTGSLRDDLLIVLEGLRLELEGFGDLIPGLVSGARRDPELARAFRENLVAPGRDGVLDILSRAKARGELPADADIDMLWRLPPAMMFLRLLITGEPLERDYVRHLVDDVVLPLAHASRRSPDPA